jgi:hypothetical protein
MYSSPPGRAIDPNSLMQAGKQFHIWLMPVDLKKLFRIAKFNHISASEMMRKLIQNFKEYREE